MQGYCEVKNVINWAELMEESDESHVEHIRWYLRMHAIMKRDNKTGLRYTPLEGEDIR